MSMAIYHSVMKVVAPVYQRIVATELNKMGEYGRGGGWCGYLFVRLSPFYL
jgi:hypothetical protein